MIVAETNDIDLGVLARGPKGDPGKDGHTPVRGTDYWTDTDKNEILNETKSYVDDAILNGKW